MFKTGELSKVFEIDRTSLNHYVKMGLLNPEVQENQYYQYSFEDVVALSYIRYYRGLGFGMSQIKDLTQKADHDDKINLFKQRDDEITQEIHLLQMKQKFLRHLTGSVKFYKDFPDQPMIAKTDGYYFIRKEDIHDSVLKELYKLIPSSEFGVEFDTNFNVTIESMKSSQGIALKEEWVKDFNISLPEKSVYYQPEEKCLCVWKMNPKTMDSELKDKIKDVMQFCDKKGYQISHRFLIYILINHYRDNQMSFDVFAQFILKKLD